MEEKSKEGEEKKEVHHKKKHENNLTEKFRENPWILSTLVLGILVLILIVGNFGGINKGAISEEDANEKVISFLNKQTGGGVAYVSSEDLGDLYEITVSYRNQDISVYTTKDGNYFAQTVAPLILTDNLDNQNQEIDTTATEISKSDKPKVELFVMSYCPYGTQAEKGILPVVALLWDKIDFKLRMVHYVLHGEKEDTENKRQICIREEQGQDKLNKYLVCILNSSDPYAPYDVSVCEKNSGINSAKLKTCLSTKASDYFASDSELSQNYGVRGSPTLIINGVESSAGRSPSSYLTGICSAFNEAPEECSEELSTSTPSPGFGYNQGTDTIAQC